MRRTISLLVLLWFSPWGAVARAETLDLPAPGNSPLTLIGDVSKNASASETARRAGTYSDNPFVQPEAGDLKTQAAGFLHRVNPLLAIRFGPIDDGGPTALFNPQPSPGSALKSEGVPGAMPVPEAGGMSLLALTLVAVSIQSRGRKRTA